MTPALRVPLLWIGAALTFAPSPVSAGTLRYAEDRAPALVQPLFATTLAEARLHELVYEGLFADDPQLRARPQLAASSELAPDGRSMSITLADRVWHDGRPVRADDVVFTIAAMKDPATASSEAGRVAWITSARAIDDRTVSLTFAAEERSPQDKLYFKILPSHKFASPAVSRADPYRTAPIGSGPWRVTSFNDDASITMNAVGDRTVGIDEFVMREVADKNYQAKLLIYESLEALVRVLPRDLATLQSDRKIELYPYQTNSWWYFGMNHSHSALSNPKVREALALMVDVPSLLAPIGTGDRVTGPFVPSSPFYDHAVPAVAHDPDRAAELLAEAGYTFNGTRWLGGDGKELRLRFVTASNLETAQDVLINVQSQLRSRGVQVDTEFLGAAEWKDRVWRQRDFDVVLSQWSFDRNEDIWEQFHSKGQRNFIGYRSEAVDELLDGARTSVDPQEKRALLQRAHAAIAKDHPMVFLWTLDSYSALSTKVQRVVVHPFYFFTWASDWTL
jgi:peptide/nickel transport system substrate-binding protein